MEARSRRPNEAADDDTADTLLRERQTALEADMVSTGQARHRSQTARAVAAGRGIDTDAGRALRQRAITEFYEDLERFVDEALRGAPGPRHVTVALLRSLFDQSDRATVLRKCAIITADHAISAAASHRLKTVTSVAGQIGTDIATEAIAEAMHDAAPGLLNAIVRNAKDRQASPTHIGHAIRTADRKGGTSYAPWTEREQMEVGVTLLDRLCARGDLVTSLRLGIGRRAAYHLAFVRPIAEWFTAYNDAARSLAIAHMPMIERPKPWTGLVGGGYRSDTVRPLHFVKRDYGQRREILEAADLSRVFAAVNAVQNTAWQINADVLNVAMAAWDHNITIGSLPRREPTPPPTMTDAARTDAPGGEHRRQYRAAASAAHVERVQELSPRIQAQRTLRIAERFADEPAVYFPCQCDFRGRVYYVAQSLSPQCGDLARGLLRFAVGKPLGSDGAKWLAIHGANVFGIGKVSFDDRIAWAHSVATAALVRRVVDDPIGNRTDWSDTDEPWQFLAWCFEWAAYLDSDDREGFVSHIPVALDGSCNGLQHFSAMLRDEVAGAAVNLVPHDVPQDIYRAVAERTMSILHEQTYAPDASADDKLFAHCWRMFGVDRAITKRAVMTLPYGAQNQSRTNYIQETVAATGRDTGFGIETDRAIRYLVRIIERAMREVLPKPMAALSWLQQAASTALREDPTAPLVWTTPSGFVVVQSEREADADWRINWRYLGGQAQLTVKAWRDTQDRARHRAATAPNFIQSHDAAHLVLAINECVGGHGIDAFSVNHDSFACHAAGAGRMSLALRRSFAGMYSGHDTLAQFADDLEVDLRRTRGVKLGTLDLAGVSECEYLFA